LHLKTHPSPEKPRTSPSAFQAPGKNPKPFEGVTAHEHVHISLSIFFFFFEIVRHAFNHNIILISSRSARTGTCKSHRFEFGPASAIGGSGRYTPQSSLMATTAWEIPAHNRWAAQTLSSCAMLMIIRSTSRSFLQSSFVHRRRRCMPPGKGSCRYIWRRNVRLRFSFRPCECDIQMDRRLSPR
jgi:hypothetical protein